jgi:tetratricopeptide (TPR) repeat protein/predicted Ser/Thr protein kinase
MSVTTGSFWPRVRQLFQEVMELEAGARAARIAACDDARVRAEVESLLAAHEETFLESSLWEIVDQKRRDALSGATLGAYRIVRPLGEGGMGSVFLAVRDDAQFDQRVAIKIVRGGAAADSIVRRFLQERQILAALEHPNIARLIDGGTTRDGLPYLVMEYIDGVPLDRYCAEQRPSTRARLELFLHLCEAVQYAHRNLVIHRDLKPANVLITSDGTPKLLDFGIAKLTASASDALLSPTMTRMMTPDYASPEQLRGEPVSTATDVYSLGVLLYEMLTGSRPFFGPARLPDAEPARPSTHTRSLRGDLDNILLKAIAVDPARRYASVEQFGEDIRRYLGGHPVAARRDSFAYVASKFVRRNKLAVSVIAIAFFAVIAAFVATYRQKQIAERRFDEVRGLARDVVFDIHDAIAPLPGSTPARELLVRRALVYLDHLSREASNNTPLAMELARAYLKIGDVQGRPYQPNLGDTAGALQSYAKALAVATAAGAREPRDEDVLALLADTHDRIGIVDQRALHWVSAMREHQAALAIRRRISMTPRRALDLAQTWLAVGDSAYIGHAVMPPEWRNVSPGWAYQSSLLALDAVPPAGPFRGARLEAVAHAHARLGGLLSNGAMADPRDPGACVRHQQAALEAFRQRLALEPSSATARRNLADQSVMMATAQLFVGDDRGALASTESALAELRPLAAADPTNAEAQHDISFALLVNGRAHFNLGEVDAAELAFRDDLAILTRLAADASNREARRDMGSAWGGLASVCEARGDQKCASADLAESLRVLKAVTP